MTGRLTKRWEEPMMGMPRGILYSVPTSDSSSIGAVSAQGQHHGEL